MKDFRMLEVWQKADQLTLLVYRSTAAFPRTEIYGLTSQIRRACASIPANLAEGCGRPGNAASARFCSIAMGSASELDYHLLLAKDLGFLATGDYGVLDERATEVKRMLAALWRKVKADC